MSAYSGDFLFPTDMPLYMIKKYLPAAGPDGKTRCGRAVDTICCVVEALEKENAGKVRSKEGLRAGRSQKPKY